VNVELITVVLPVQKIIISLMESVIMFAQKDITVMIMLFQNNVNHVTIHVLVVLLQLIPVVVVKKDIIS